MGDRDGQQARASAREEDAPVPGQQQAMPAKQTSGAQANHMVASLLGHRVTPPAKAEHDFGEHIVGSDNNVEHIHAPWNLTDTPAMAEFSVSGEAFQLTSLNVMALKPSNSMHGDDLTYAERASPKIAFRPRRTGEFQGTLTIKISWPMDGHVETQSIALRGRAREVTQAPVHFGPEPVREQAGSVANTTPEASSRDEVESDGLVTRKDLRKKDQVDDAIDNAAAAARKLARSQQEGLTIAEREAEAYGKEIPKVPRSKWWDLAELAMNLATGSLAGLVASKLLPSLLTRNIVVDDVPMMGTIRTTITPRLSEHVTDTVKSALIFAGQKAINAAVPSETGSAPAMGGGSPEKGRHSSNQRIDFFSTQRNILYAQEDAYEEKVKQHAQSIRPFAMDQPKLAVEALAVVAKQFDSMKLDAEQQQANAVAPAWATLVARLGLGQEVVRTAEQASDPRYATQMDALRRYDRGNPTSASGVLDVYVSSGKVVSAKLNGVAQEIADRLGDMALAQIPMPIRFIMGRPGEPRPTILTRDEAGRVRVQGELTGHAHEQESVRTATETIERILSVPLASLGVQVQTDDSTGRGP